MVQITQATELKDLQQCAARAQEHQQKHCEQLDEFQDLGVQLAIKVVATLQDVQESWQMVNGKATEEHPVQQMVINCQDTIAKVQLQVQDTAQQFVDFKDKTVAYTLLTWHGSRVSHKIVLGECWQGVGVSELRSVIAATQACAALCKGSLAR